MEYSNTEQEGVSPSPEPIAKCKHIATLEEVRGLQKCDHPHAVSSSNGALGRPDLMSITKAAQTPAPRMGRGVDPHEVVKNDWEDYHRMRGITKTFIS